MFYFWESFSRPLKQMIRRNKTYIDIGQKFEQLETFYINSSPSNHHLIQPNIKIVLQIVLIFGGLFPHLKSYVY